MYFQKCQAINLFIRHYGSGLLLQFFGGFFGGLQVKFHSAVVRSGISHNVYRGQTYIVPGGLMYCIPRKAFNVSHVLRSHAEKKFSPEVWNLLFPCDLISTWKGCQKECHLKCLHCRSLYAVLCNLFFCICVVN